MFRKTTLFCLLLAVGIFSACTLAKRILNPNYTLLTLEVETDLPNIVDIIEQSKMIISARLDAIGVDHEFIEDNAQNNKQFSIKIYDTENLQKVKQFILEQGNLQLFGAVSPPYPSPLQTFPTKEKALETLGGSSSPNQKVLKYTERNSIENSPEQWIIVKTPAIVDGADIRDASAVSLTGDESNYQIMFSLKPQGATKFGEWTGMNINNYLAVSLNDEVRSVAFIKSQIFDQGQIDGRFTKENAEDLALILRSGSLPVKVKIIKEEKSDKLVR
jgi:protein-export membrane protein SecD